MAHVTDGMSDPSCSLYRDTPEIRALRAEDHLVCGSIAGQNRYHRDTTRVAIDTWVRLWMKKEQRAIGQMRSGFDLAMLSFTFTVMVFKVS